MRPRKLYHHYYYYCYVYYYKSLFRSFGPTCRRASFEISLSINEKRLEKIGRSLVWQMA